MWQTARTDPINPPPPRSPRATTHKLWIEFIKKLTPHLYELLVNSSWWIYIGLRVQLVFEVAGRRRDSSFFSKPSLYLPNNINKYCDFDTQGTLFLTLSVCRCWAVCSLSMSKPLLIAERGGEAEVDGGIVQVIQQSTSLSGGLMSDRQGANIWDVKWIKMLKVVSVLWYGGGGVECGIVDLFGCLIWLRFLN